MIRSFGKLLVVTVGFAVYYLAIIIILAWMVSLVLMSVYYGSGAALLFTAKTLLPLTAIIGLLVLFYRVIKRSRQKQRNTTPKEDGSVAN
jgi:hypothetical protein